MSIKGNNCFNLIVLIRIWQCNTLIFNNFYLTLFCIVDLLSVVSGRAVSRTSDQNLTN
jgi:hypothetical protein